MGIIGMTPGIIGMTPGIRPGGIIIGGIIIPGIMGIIPGISMPAAASSDASGSAWLASPSGVTST